MRVGRLCAIVFSAAVEFDWSCLVFFFSFLISSSECIYPFNTRERERERLSAR